MTDAAALRALEQGSPEWIAARVGSVGASRVSDVVAKNKDGKTASASRQNYLVELLLERMTGKPAAKFKSRAMQDGLDREPIARALYTLETGNQIERVGLIRHPTIEGAHASPDGLVGADGMVSFKCPEPAAHLESILNKAVTKKAYRDQMQWEFACCPERLWCDFVSFSPEFQESRQIVIRSRIVRDTLIIRELEFEVVEFLRDLKETIAALEADDIDDVEKGIEHGRTNRRTRPQPAANPFARPF